MHFLSESLIISGAWVVLFILGLFQAEMSGDWVDFLLDKTGLAAFAALALWMLRQSYTERIQEKQRHADEIARLYQSKDQLRLEHQEEIKALSAERDRMSADFREEMVTLHQVVLTALTNNTSALSEFTTRVERCPVVLPDVKK